MRLSHPGFIRPLGWAVDPLALLDLGKLPCFVDSSWVDRVTSRLDVFVTPLLEHLYDFTVGTAVRLLLLERLCGFNVRTVV